MLENPIVSNSTRKSENLFGADNQQERLQYSKEGIIMKTIEQLLEENERLLLRVNHLERELEVFQQEEKSKEELAKWQDEAHARTKRLYPE